MTVPTHLVLKLLLKQHGGLAGLDGGGAEEQLWPQHLKRVCHQVIHLKGEGLPLGEQVALQGGGGEGGKFESNI